MKTAELYILLITPANLDKETETDTLACGQALWNKYKRDTPGRVIRVIPKRGTKVQEETFTKHLVTYQFPFAEQGDITGTNPDTGVYVVGNCSYTSGTLEHLTPAFLAGIIKDCGPKQIRKLSLVACNSMRVPQDKRASYAELLAQELAKSPGPLTPMVAGWDKYVEVIVSGIPRLRETAKEGVFEQDGNVGRKIVGVSSNKRDFAKNHPESKKVLQWSASEGKVLPVDKGWSDKTG